MGVIRKQKNSENKNVYMWVGSSGFTLACKAAKENNPKVLPATQAAEDVQSLEEIILRKRLYSFTQQQGQSQQAISSQPSINLLIEELRRRQQCLPPSFARQESLSQNVICPKPLYIPKVPLGHPNPI
jgi:hypothetical protein